MIKLAFRSLLAASVLSLAACGNDNSGSSGSGGQSGGSHSSSASASSGGSQGGGGSSANSAGGQSSSVQSSGGAGSTGGKTSTGTAGTGGKTGTGGTAAGGSDEGGQTSTGGKTGTGGTTGATGTGGKTGTGGTGAGGTAAGGTTGSGGAGSGGATGTGGSTGSGGTSGGKLHVFLLLGQSNMAGYAKAQDSDKENSPRIRVIGFDDCAATGRKKDQWADAAPPLHECWNSAVGPGDSFSKALLAKLPATDSILLVPCALSGKSINEMKKGTSNYTWFISRAKSAVQLGGVIEGFIFHQGESDCGQSTWPATVKQFVTDLRTDLSLTNNPPFLAGELPRASACKNHNPLVNQLPGLITNGYVVTSENLELDPGDTQYNMHFGHKDTVELGQRFATKMAEALKW